MFTSGRLFPTQNLILRKKRKDGPGVEQINPMAYMLCTQEKNRTKAKKNDENSDHLGLGKTKNGSAKNWYGLAKKRYTLIPPSWEFRFFFFPVVFVSGT